MEPGELLRAARLRHGLTQGQLAARARTSQAAISRIERGLVSPTVETLAKLLDLMNEELKLTSKPVDHGFDLTLYDKTLPFSPEQRIRHQAQWANQVRELQRDLRREL